MKKSKEFFKGTCSLNSCKTKVGKSEIFCEKHWRYLTKEIKRDIFKFWYEGDLDSLSFAIGFAKGLINGEVSVRDYTP